MDGELPKCGHIWRVRAAARGSTTSPSGWYVESTLMPSEG